LLGLFSVCIGIYQVSQSLFLRAKRGSIVVNCVVDVDTKVLVRRRLQFLYYRIDTELPNCSRLGNNRPGQTPTSEENIL
jgi:hypothetical protein